MTMALVEPLGLLKAGLLLLAGLFLFIIHVGIGRHFSLNSGLTGVEGLCMHM